MKPLIFIVDEEPISLRLLEMSLKDQGYEIRCFSTGLSALACFKSSPADLVITDIFLPDLDGNELTCTMKKIKPKVKVIGISGTPDTKFVDVLNQSKLAGSDLTFSKPVMPAQLIEGIRSLL